MRPIRIIIEDFMSHKYTDIDCTQFNSVLIVGKNRNNPLESNAVGKTTVFRAIEYVLFGFVVTKHLDSVVRDGCDKCKVTLEIEISGEVFKIVRSRNKKTSKSDLRLYKKDSDWTDITQKTSSETEYELSKIVKISLVAFQNSVHFAQSDLRGLASVTARERKAMLKEPLQISIYSKYEKIAKEKTSLLKEEVEKLNTLIKVIGDPKSDISSLEENSLNIIKNIDSYSIEYQNYQKEINDNVIKHSELIKSSQNDSDGLKREIVQIHSDLANLKNSLLSINSSLKEKTELLNFASSKFISLKKEIDILCEEKTSLEGRKPRDIVEVKSDREKFASKELEGAKLLAKLDNDKQRLIKNLPGGDICGHCFQQVSKEHRDSYEVKRLLELSGVQENIVKFNKTLILVRNKKQEIENELYNIQIFDKKLVDVSHSISKKEMELNQFTVEVGRWKEYCTSKATESTQCVDKINNLILKRDELNSKIEEKNDISIKNKIDELQIKLNSLNIKLTSLGKEISNFNVEKGMNEAKLISRKNDSQELERLQGVKKITEKSYQMSLKVVQAFSSSGIPTLIINTILDDLQIIVNELLLSLRPGMEIIFSVIKNKSDGQQEDTLDIDYRINGVNREYEQLSGGQKLLVALSLKLGMSLIIQHRIGVDIKFLELDEVDQSLDPAAVSALADVIKKWQEKFTIFIITHNDSLKNNFNFGILVEADGENGSSGKLVTQW